MWLRATLSDGTENIPITAEGSIGQHRPTRGEIQQEVPAKAPAGSGVDNVVQTVPQ